MIHGSFDWFWEFAGLGAPAFAMLGIACALAHPRGHARIASAQPGSAAASRAGARRALLAARASLASLAAVALAWPRPWLSQLQVESAAHVWTKAPQTAYARLRQAAT